MAEIFNIQPACNGAAIIRESCTIIARGKIPFNFQLIYESLSAIYIEKNNVLNLKISVAGK